MIMKKILLSLLLTAFSATTWAGDYDYLVVELSSGEKASFESAGLALTYSETELTVTPASGEVSKFTLTDLSKMYFSNTPTGVEKVQAVNDGPVKVYTVDGAYVGEFESLTIAKENLLKGTYVVNSQSNNLKISIP